MDEDNMTIDNHCGRDDQKQTGSRAEAHSLIALEQSALYAANLAIARWINNSSADPAQRIVASEPASARAAWYAQAQQNFQEWLALGGFAQYDCADLADPATETAPLAGTANLPA
jgi:hypothetical protein